MCLHLLFSFAESRMMSQHFFETSISSRPTSQQTNVAVASDCEAQQACLICNINKSKLGCVCFRGGKACPVCAHRRDLKDEQVRYSGYALVPHNINYGHPNKHKVYRVSIYRRFSCRYLVGLNYSFTRRNK